MHDIQIQKIKFDNLIDIENFNLFFFKGKIKITSKYNVSTIKAALNKIFNIHSVLCCSIISQEDNVVFKEGSKPNVIVIKNEDKAKIANFYNKAFVLDKGLSRFLIEKKQNCSIIHMAIHYSIFDHLSYEIFKNDLFAILDGKNPNIDNEFFKFLEENFINHNSRKCKKTYDFYEKELINLDEIIEFIPDIHENIPSHNNINLNFNNSNLDKFLKQHNLSHEVFYYSIFAYTLSRFTFSDNAYFTILSDCRNNINLPNSIGMFQNTLPIIINCKQNTIDKYLELCKAKIENTIKYKSYHFVHIKNTFNIKNNICMLFNDSKEDSQNKNIEAIEQNLNSLAYNCFDILLVASKDSVSIISNGKYSNNTCYKLLLTYERILNEFLKINKLKDIEYTLNEDIKIINQLNKTEKALKYHDILEAFNNSLEKYPNNTLVSYLDIQYTYLETAKWINNLEQKLKNIPEHSNIAILTHRSHYYLLAALGILNHNCTYVPIDDNYPDERIKFMFEDSNSVAILVTDETFKRAETLTNIELINISNIKNTGKLKQLNKVTKQNDTSVILYTSGTTGKPKGCLITNKGIINLCEWYVDNTKLNNKDKFCFYQSFAFDVHIEVFYSCILAGSCINIVPDDIKLDIKKFGNYLDENNITHADLPSAFLRIFVENYKPKTLKSIFGGGEQLGKLNNITSCTIYDSYGPTETTVIETAIKDNDKCHYSSIGKPLYNTKFYILDNNQKMVPYGALGELYISGYQLSKGYLNNDKVNKNSFFDNPFDGDKAGYERMYKTGDVVRYLPDGTIGFIGRADSQVKIRGNRVELGEVEAVIREIKEVDDVTIQTVKNNKNIELIAYVVSNNKNIKNIITKYVNKHKPSYMLPSYIVLLDKIPLNANGKVNKHALPKINIDNYKTPYIAPTNNIEKSICDAFTKVFDIKIGINDDFIKLGGNSLTAIQIAIYTKLENIKVGDILTLRTPKLIAKKLESPKLTNEHLYNEVYGKHKSDTEIFTNVYSYMNNAEYWLSKIKNPDKIILSKNDITVINNNIEKWHLKNKTNYFYKFINSNNKIEEKKFILDTLTVANEYYGEYGEYVKNNVLTKMSQFNNKNDYFKISYGFTLQNSNLYACAYYDKYMKLTNNNNIDDFKYSTAVFLDPIIILDQTIDHKWSLIYTKIALGWIESKNIAKCKNYKEWLEIQNPLKFAIILDDEIDFLPKNKLLKNSYHFYAGTRLPIQFKDCKKTKVNNTKFVLFPYKDKNDYINFCKIKTPKNIKLSFDYLDLTIRNLFNIGFNAINKPFVFADVSERNCASYISLCYRVFGFDLLPTVKDMEDSLPCYDVKNNTIAEKKKLLNDLHWGSLIFMPNHVSMYLGKNNNKYYLLSAVISLCDRDENNKPALRYTYKIMVNDIEYPLRLTGQSWLEDTNKIWNIINSYI